MADQALADVADLGDADDEPILPAASPLNLQFNFFFQGIPELLAKPAGLQLELLDQFQNEEHCYPSPAHQAKTCFPTDRSYST